MNRSLLLAVVFLILYAVPLSAAELTQIDRKIVKEPAYKSKPKYCLVVFGPEAKTRVWLVRDGDVLYVDRNANGDLTETGKRIAGKKFAGAITEIDGTSKLDLTFSVDQNGKGQWEIADAAADFDSAFTKYKQRLENRIQFADRPQDAPVIHFDGRLTFAPREDRGVIRNGQWVRRKDDTTTPDSLPNDDERAMVHVQIGTQSLGTKENKFVPAWLRYPVPEMRPIAEIEFPNSDPDAKPIKIQVRLKVR